MAKVKEKVSKDLVVEYEGAVNVKEFLAVLRKWCVRYEYDIEEKLHKTKGTGDGRVTTIEWKCDRKPDDYHRYYVNAKVTINAGKEGMVDGEKVMEGSVAVKVYAELESDYEGRWQRPTQRFLRAVYDRFFMEEKESRMVRRVKDDAQSMLDEAKRYLNV